MCAKKERKARVIQEPCNELELGNNQAGLKEITLAQFTLQASHKGLILSVE